MKNTIARFKMKGPGLTLFQKTAMAVALILLPLAFTFGVNYSSNREHLRAYVLGDLSVMAEAYKGQVYQLLERCKARASDFASDGYIRDELKKMLVVNGYSNDPLARHLRMNKLPLDMSIDSIYVISMDGVIKAATDNADAGRDVSKEPFFLAGKAAPSATEFMPGTGAGFKPGLIFASPIKDRESGKTLGVLANVTRLSGLNSLLSGTYTNRFDALSWSRGRRKTMEVYIVNRDKLMMTESIFIKDAALNQKVDTAPVRACLESNGEGASFYEGYRGVRVAGASTCLPELKWTLLVEVDSDNALAASNMLLRNAAITVGVIAALIPIMFAIFIKKVVTPIRHLAKASDAVASGDLDINIPVETSDEIGALAQSFNAMTRDIRERNLALKAEMNTARSYFDIAGVVMLVLDKDGRVALVNRKGSELLGLGVDEIIGKDWVENFLPPRLRARARAVFEDIVCNRLKPYDYHENPILTDKGERTIAWRHNTLVDKGGNISAVVCSGEDITERINALEAEAAHKGRIVKEQVAIIRLATRSATVLEELPDAVKFIAEVVAETLGVERASVWLFEDGNARIRCLDLFTMSDKSHTGGALISASDYPSYFSAIEAGRAIDASDAQNDPRTSEYRDGYLVPNGIASMLDAPIRIAGKLAGILCLEHTGPARKWTSDEIGFAADVGDQLAQAFIEDRRRAREAEFRRLSLVIEHSINVVYITDAGGVINYINPAFEAVTGYAKEETLGKEASALVFFDPGGEDYDRMWKTIQAGKTWHGVVKGRKKDGLAFWTNTVITPMRDEKGDMTGFMTVAEDISAKMASEEKIQYLSAYDAQTGLYNRDRFIKELTARLAFSELRQKPGALLFIGLDHFQFFNDTYGHVAGDQVLKDMAGLLKNYTATLPSAFSKDSVPLIGRLGSDEFAVYLQSVDATLGFAVCEEIRKAIELMRTNPPDARMTASIGIVEFPEHRRNVADLFSKADAAMFKAKELGKNRCHLYSDKDIEDIHVRSQWKDRIIKALEDDRFVPWFQPILDLKTGQVTHYEALARMRSEDGQILLPAVFIDTAERFSLIGAIDRAITKKVMAVQSGLMKAGSRYTFSMNLSGKNMGDHELLEFLVSTAKDTGADPASIIFEITETASIKDFDNAVRFTNDLKALGFRFSLDDFGVGFTSFSYLKEMNVDYIKIDGSFIKKLDENEKNRLFVKAITTVASGMGIKTVAEFVERESVVRLLKEYNVDYGQGYFIGKPDPEVVKMPVKKQP